nr:CDP-alcohol phosphatidyltransferase family protein [Actinomycetales bacterium]
MPGRGCENGGSAASGRRPVEESTRVWTIPNIISFLRLALIPVFGYLILTERDVAAIVVL